MKHTISFKPLLVHRLTIDKTVTRRLAKPSFDVGDIVGVKEQLEPRRFITWNPQGEYAVYSSDGCGVVDGCGENAHLVHWRWKLRVLPAIFCPHAYIRHELLIVSITKERLQAITEEDARREGVSGLHELGDTTGVSARDQFAYVWDMLNKRNGDRWVDNPWVWRIEFKLKRKGGIREGH